MTGGMGFFVVVAVALAAAGGARRRFVGADHRDHRAGGVAVHESTGATMSETVTELTVARVWRP
jgi:hypothetical protein